MSDVPAADAAPRTPRRRDLRGWLLAHREALTVALPALLLLWLPYRIGWQRSWWHAESLDAYQALIPLGALALARLRWDWLKVVTSEDLEHIEYGELISGRVSFTSLLSAYSPQPGGLSLLLLGCALWLFNLIWSYQEVSALALFLLATGAVLYRYGPRGVLALSTPLLFLLLMMPLPRLVSGHLSQMLQLNTTRAAGWTLHAVGLPVRTLGNTLILPHYRLEVTEACGGAGILLGLLVLTIWMLGMMQATAYQRAVLLLLAVVLEIPLNILRVMVMGLLGLWAPKLAGALHDANSWLFTLLLFWLMFRLSHLLNVRKVWSAPNVSESSLS
jgi:exosortase